MLFIEKRRDRPVVAGRSSHLRKDSPQGVGMSLPLDLNCDLAEHEPPGQTAALMALVTSANLACGGHAGTEATLRHALRLAKTHGVHAGAHPGLPGAFGRAETPLTPTAFRELLHRQLGLFLRLAAEVDVSPHHLKLHGALYHATERDPALRDVLIEVVKTEHPSLIIYALAGGTTLQAARAAGLEAWDEAFADRGYRSDGSLVSRTEPSAVIDDPATVAARLHAWQNGQPVLSVNGEALSLLPRTVCVHGDTPHSVALLQAARCALETTPLT